MLVSSVKQPVNWNVDEIEPNDSFSEAQLVEDGDEIFGGFATSGDNDFYKIVVPANKHLLTLDVEAMEYGSAANTSILLKDENQNGLPSDGYEWYYGEEPSERDPFVAWNSVGDEVLYFNIREWSSRGGRPYWYMIKVTLEDQ